MSVVKGTISGNVGGFHVSAVALVVRCDVKGCRGHMSWIDAPEPDFRELDEVGWANDGNAVDHCPEHASVPFVGEHDGSAA